MAEIHVVVVTPEATVVDTKTSFVAIPFYDGEMGIATNHAPLIGRLGYGELRFEEGGKTVRYFIDGGFVQVANNVVSVMANRALPAKHIVADEARQRLGDAVAERASGEQLNERAKRVAQARAMVRIAERA
jgi:F-type H+-transporting ATPase subunit epsilon